MRFVCEISHQGNLVARMSCDPREGETHQETADRAKETLLRDAYRHGREKHPAIESIAETYHQQVVTSLASSSGGTLSVVTDDQGEIIARFPGGVAVSLDRRRSWNGLVRVLSDADIERTRVFLESTLAKP